VNSCQGAPTTNGATGGEKLILESDLAEILIDIKVRPEDVAKIAVGPKHCPDATFGPLEALLYEIIGGDVFGADRIDYLLRDAYHAGVAYGRFDHLRLIYTMRILPRSDQDSDEPWLGVERGGLEAAESLLWARYLMYTQLYFHPVRPNLRYSP
jgi:HD superfamily phosphohydrolase